MLDGDVPIWRDSHLTRLLGNPSVSLSLTLSRNENVVQHIRKKTHKPIVFKILVWRWCQSLMLVWLGSHCCGISLVNPPRKTLQWYQSRFFVLVIGSNEYNMIPVSKIFLTKVLVRYSWLEMLSLEGDIPMWKSITLSISKKVEENIRKKTYKLINYFKVFD